MICITALLPHLQNLSTCIIITTTTGIFRLYTRIAVGSLSRLFRTTRKYGLAAALEPAMAVLQAAGVLVGVEATVVTSAGVMGNNLDRERFQRLDLDSIIGDVLIGDKACSNSSDGMLEIVVCWPPRMADHMCHKVVRLSRTGVATGPYLLVD